MATAEMAFSSGLNSSSGGELKLYLSCTGSTMKQKKYSGDEGYNPTFGESAHKN